MNCFEVQRGDYIEKYLRGELSEEESQELEKHYFSCEDCYESLRDLSAARTELAKERWSVPDKRPGTGWVGGWAWAWAAALLILAVGLAIWLRSPEPMGLSEEVMTELAAIEPPPYAPRSLRSPEEEAEDPFAEAMIPYRQGDYLRAADRLEGVVQVHPRNATVHFYLGASYLLTDRPELAITSLGTVLELGEGRYLEWARMYRAKAHLRLGELEAARDDLEAVASQGGELAAIAQGLLDQL